MKEELEWQEYPSDDEEDDTDSDLIKGEALNSCFGSKCNFITEHLVARNKYILHIDGTHDSTPNIAIGVSNYTTEVLNISNNQIARTCQLDQAKDNIIAVKFCNENKNIVYTASSKGFINKWDIRLSQRLVNVFKDVTAASNKEVKPLVCFDISSNNRVLAAGTEQVGSDAYLLFWDIRKPKLLGGYWETHTDDITQLKFHPSEADKLISGSTDGLINIFDISQSCEDDALIDSLNTESSVEQLNWHCSGLSDIISTTTHTADVQLWKTDDVRPFIRIDRDKISEKIKRKNSDHCFVVNAHNNRHNDIFVLAGSNYDEGQCLRSIISSKNKDFESCFTLPENKQRTRSSWFNPYFDLLVTGGEKGLLNVWKIEFDKSDTVNKKIKIEK